MSGNFIFRHHVERRVKLCSPREESFPAPLKYTDVSRTTHTNLDVMQESRIDDYWNNDASRDLSDSWTVFTQFTLFCDKPPEGYMWSGRRLTKRQATSRPDHLWPELWRGMARNAKLREKHKRAIEKQSSIMLESISLTLRTWSSRKPLGLQEENWKHQWLQPCLARHARKTSTGLMISSLILRVSWEPVNPQECVWKNLYQNIMRTFLQEKGTTQYNITIWCANLFLCLRQWRYPQQKQQWIKNGRNLKRFRRGTLQKSEVNQRWSTKQGRRAEKFIFASLMDVCHLKNAELETKHQQYKGRIVLRGDIVKDDSVLMQYSQNKDHQHHKWR